MKTICKLDCCKDCSDLKECGGCQKTNGHPFGGTCIAADCINKNGYDKYLVFKDQLVSEFNALEIKDLEVNDLNLLMGAYVNLEYELANGQKVKLLVDNKIYFGNQIEKPGHEECYGVVADENYLLVCEYGCNGTNPKIVVYKRR